MVKNYFKTAWRNMMKQKLFSVINITGLALGIATAFLIWNYVSHEFSYDSIHLKKNRIYRVESRFYEGDRLTDDWGTSTFGYGSALKKEFPGVQDFVRLSIHQTEQVVRYRDIKIRENKITYTEPSFFRIFDYKLLEGDRSTALNQPNTVVITKAAAKRFFPNEPAMGKVLRFAVADKYVDCAVTGILENFPDNSHISFDYLISYESLPLWMKDFWYLHEAYTYVLLQPGTTAGQIEDGFSKMSEKYKTLDALRSKRWAVTLVPLSRIHLNPQKAYEREVKGNKISLMILMVIALLILLSAWINYINLVTARSMDRAKEVGIRKAIGATRSQLIQQYIIESAIANIAAIILAASLIYLFYPYFTWLTGKNIGISLFSLPLFWISLVLLIITGVFVSAYYPAMVLSALKPALVLKGKFSNSQPGNLLQKLLLVFQFSAALFLVIGMFVVQGQLKYMHLQDIGADIDRTIVMKYPVSSADLKVSVEQFCEKLRSFSQVKSVTVTGSVPGLEVAKFASNTVYGSSDKSARLYEMLTVDYEYLNTFNLQLASGRSFIKHFGDERNNILVNEESLKQLGIASAREAIGKKIVLEAEKDPVEIIGVLKNWHQRGLGNIYTPIILILNGRLDWVPAQYIAVKISGNDMGASMGILKNKWKEYFPESSFDAFFLDSFYNEQYVADVHFEKVAGFFTGLAIFITILGLWALSSYTAVKKTKEIGIRKVYGAGVRDILLLFSKKMFFIFLIAFLITVPISWFIMNGWLNGFAFHTSVHLWLYLLGGLAIVTVSLVTIIWQSWRVAIQNPVKSLRTE